MQNMFFIEEAIPNKGVAIIQSLDESFSESKRL